MCQAPLPPQSSEDNWKRMERIEEVDTGEKCWDMLASGLDVAVVLLNSQHLWLPTQDPA